MAGHRRTSVTGTSSGAGPAILTILALAVLVAAVIAVSPFASDDSDADSATSGDCTVVWDYNGITVTGNGRMADYQPWDNVPWGSSGENTLRIESGVTYVGNHSFYRNTSLGCIIVDTPTIDFGSNIVQATVHTIYWNSGSEINTGANTWMNCAELLFISGGSHGAVSGGPLGNGDVTLNVTVTTDDGYAFLGFNTSPDGTGDWYQIGDGYDLHSGKKILYAQYASIKEWDTGNCTLTYNPGTRTAEVSAKAGIDGAMADYASADEVPWKDSGSGFRALIVGQGVTVGAHAFDSCSGLNTVYWNQGTDPEPSSAVWDGCPADMLFISAGGHCTVSGDQLGTGEVSLYVDVSCDAGYAFSEFNTEKGRDGDSKALGSKITVSGRTVLYTFSQLKWISKYAAVYFDPDTGVMRTEVISGWGYMANYSSHDDVPWKDYSSQVKTLIIRGTPVGDYAFSGFTSITNLDQCLFFDHIGAHAFEGCTALQSVDTSQDGGYNSSGVLSIGAGAFAGCTSLQSATVHFRISQMAEDVFAGCTSLRTVYWNPDIDSDTCSWSDCPADMLFVFSTYGCRVTGRDLGASPVNLSGITVTPWSVGVFNGFGTYDGTTWTPSDGNGFAYTGRAAVYALCDFEWTSGNCTVVLDPLTRAFTVSPVEGTDGAMADCDYPWDVPWSSFGDSVTSLTIDSGVTHIGKNAFTEMTAFTGTLTIPDSVTSIGESAFEGSAIGSLHIGSGITDIPAKAFGKCRNLSGLTIPDTVTSIGNRAFENCDALSSLVIPSTVTSMGEHVFDGCDDLCTVYDYSGLFGAYESMSGCAVFNLKGYDGASIVSSGEVTRYYGYFVCTLPVVSDDSLMWYYGDSAYAQGAEMRSDESIALISNEPENEPEVPPVASRHGHTETVSGLTVYVEKTELKDDSSATVASYTDGDVRVYSVYTIDKDGNSEGRSDSVVASDSGTASLSSEDIQGMIGAARATAEAAGFEFSSLNVTVLFAYPTQSGIAYAEIDLSSYKSGLGSVTLEGDSGSLALDGDTLAGLAGKSVKMGIGKADTVTLTDGQRAIAEKYDVLDIGAVSDGTAVHALNGKATVRIPYILKDGEDASDVKLYYLDANGNVKAVGGTYEDGYLTAELEHFSYYFASGSYGSGGFSMDDESAMRLSIGTAAAMIVLVAGAAVAFRRR